MSKIGKKEILIPAWVQVTLSGNVVHVKWPKGQLSLHLIEGVTVEISAERIIVKVNSDEIKNLWWLTRTLIANMVQGVSQGYQKKLLILWVGYWAKVQGNIVQLNLGFSHPVKIELPPVVKVVAEKDTKGNDILVFDSIDKQMLWQVVAKIRSIKSPEPYKWKGIRYIDEVIKLKAGKTAKK